MRTARQFIADNTNYTEIVTYQDSPDTSDCALVYEACERLMIEFTKIHVKAAIKECISSAPSGSSTDTVSYEDVVEALQDCYPLTNIK